MTELHEETHYQIALTNRQVLTAFFALLVCLFLAFFAGVWIGRGSVPTESMQADLAGDGSEATDREFRFFGRTAPGDEPADGTTIQSVKPAAEPTAEPPAQPPRRSAPKGLPPPEPMRRAAAEETPTIQPRDRGRPSESDRATAEQAVIQVHAGSDRAQAEDLVKRLRAAGYESFLAVIDGPQPYRVRVGPFGSRDLARARAIQLEKELGLETYIPPSGP